MILIQPVVFTICCLSRQALQDRKKIRKEGVGLQLLCDPYIYSITQM